MKLLVVSYYGHFASTRPEAEIYLALVQRGYTVTVITHGESEYVTWFRLAGIKVLFGHPTKRRDEAGTLVIRNELLQGDYDVLLLYNSRGIANGVRAAKDIDVKVVAYRGYAGDLRWYDPSNYLKIYHPRVDAIICNNVGVQRHIQANTVWRSDNTHVINKGHDLAWYADVESVDLAELGVPAGAPTLVCVANAAAFKGVPVLLEAIIQLSPKLGAYLILCGHDMDSTAHRELAAKSPHPERILFPGFRDDVLGIVKAADLKVLPSIKGESLTKAAIEAMAVGTPVLITDIPGNEELVEHDVSGYKVLPNNAGALARAIEQLIESEPLRNRLAAGAQRRLAGVLSHTRTVDNMDSFLRTLVPKA